MTNFEKWKDEILEIGKTNTTLGILNGKPTPCRDIDPCTECEIRKRRPNNEYGCNWWFFQWLYEEYQEPTIDWSKVAVDTKILVSDDGEIWHKRYFASYEDGRVYVWYGGGTSWSNNLTSPYNYAKLAEEDAE